MESSSSCRKRTCIGVIQLTNDIPAGFVYSSRLFSLLCWVQVSLGLASIAIYVVLYGDWSLSVLASEGNVRLSSSTVGLGLLVGGLELLSGAVTLLAVQEPNYCWLHLAMTFHVVHVVGQFLLSLSTFFLVLPGREADGDVEAVQVNLACWREWLMSFVNGSALVSVFIGSFLGAATAYGVCFGMGSVEKRKTSVDVSRFRRRELRERKLVQFKSFEPTNVAANLEGRDCGEDPPSNYDAERRDHSLVFVNRHAQCQESPSVMAPF